jgi:chromosome segregation ATPase
MVAWDVKTGRRLLAMGEEYDTILASDVSADQSLIALGGPAKRVKVYDLASGEILHNIKKHSEWVTALSFSPDGVLLATGDRNGGLHVWEAQSGNLFYTLAGHKKAITGLSWRADSNLLASASEDGSIRTWEMFNGKQVKTWTAHGGGALSVDFDKKGNLVTAGRDKTVKLWNPSGAAIRTISGFPEMVMEARYSHDGSRVIAGDWTGAVSVWNAADGKKQGDLSASPPTIASRISSALKSVDDRKSAATTAKTKHAPLAQALVAANAKLVEAKKTAASTAAAHKAADTALAAAKTVLAQATAARDKAKTDKDTRQVARDKTAKQLADAQSAQKSHKTQGDDWGKRSNFRSEQVSLLRETLRRAKEALVGVPEDISLKDAVAKQEQALTAMDNAFVQARDKTAGHLTNAETFAKQATAHASVLTAAENALKAAETALAAHEKTRSEKDSAIKAAVADQTAKLAANNAANTALAQQTKEQATASEAEKTPAQNLRDAEVSLASAVNSANKWKAETINVERHLELGKLNDLQNELNGLAAIAAEAKALHDNALAALAAAQKALAEVPVKIQAKEESLSQRKTAMTKETQTLGKAKKDTAEKQGFLNEVNDLATATKAKAAADSTNAELAAATAKFAETLALLHKDLTNSNSAITAQESKLKGAQTTVSQAEADLNQTRKLSQDAPNVVEEKLKVSKQTEAQLSANSTVRDTCKAQVTTQQAKTDSLFKKYLESLPK